MSRDSKTMMDRMNAEHPEKVLQELEAKYTMTTPSKEAEYWKDRYGVHVMMPINPEFTLCGNAFDGQPGDDEHPPMERVEPQKITCSQCREIITFIKQL